MAESTLAVPYTELFAEIGGWLGYGRGANHGDPAWPDRDERNISSVAKAGLTQFYFPPVLPGDAAAHEWSFLKPVGRIAVASGASEAPLPADFGGFSGSGTVSASNDQSYWPVAVVNESRVRQMHAASPDTTGRPCLAAERPVKHTSVLTGQRSVLALYPTTDAAYTLEFAYYLLPDMLTGTRPHVYGGAAHAQTALQSCLAVAEYRRDNAPGPMAQLFMQMLAASVSVDRRRKGDRLGVNGDPGMWRGRRVDPRISDTVTVYGVTYGS